MHSGLLKAEILGWLRFDRQQDIVCTEVGGYSADCWGLSDTRLIEVETKVTLADFKADFKKGKHSAYAEAKLGGGRPALFYFAVPVDLEAGALKILEERAGDFAVAKYGLLVVDKTSAHLGLHTRVVRSARRLHGGAPNNNERRVALRRQSSELCGLHHTLMTTRLLLEESLSRFAEATQLMYDAAEKFKNEAVPAQEDE